MNRKTFIFVALIALFCTFSHAQSTDKGYQPILDKFFSLMEKGKYADAVDYIYSTNPYMSSNPDAVTQLKSNMQGLPSLIGSYQGHEVLLSQPLSSRYTHIDALIYFDRQPLWIAFDFYKVKGKWQVNSFNFTDNFDNLREKFNQKQKK